MPNNPSSLDDGSDLVFIEIQRTEKVNGEPKVFPDYLDAVLRDPTASNWLIANQLLLNVGGGTDLMHKSIIRKAILNSVPGGARFSERELASGNLSFRNFDNVRHVTGQDFQIPTLSFSNVMDYRNFMRRLGYDRPPQGVSLYLLPEPFLQELGVREYNRPLRNFSLLVYCEEQLPGENAMPPEQILRHESMHAVDPLLHTREKSDTTSDVLILHELIATIGEIATPSDDYSRINVTKGFWIGYLSRINQFTPAFFKIFKLTGSPTVMSVSDAISEFVRKITSLGKNSDIVRMIMNCQSFSDLEQMLLKIMPKEFEYVKSSQASELVESAYYRNWPNAYTFTSRSITSLWQRKEYAIQAMQVFLQDAESLKRALPHVFKNREFDTSNMHSLQIEEKETTQGYQISVSW